MQTPKGMRDFLPEDMIQREQVIEKIKKAFKKYGFRPLETPAMETMEVLTAKAGDEIKSQIFRIEDSDWGLRFDLTVPLARVAANTQYPKPFKRYCIGRVWRREEPQKGRFREFWQADADIIGSKSMRCEAELLSMANSLLYEFGFKKPKILLNNRKILDALAASLDIEEKKNRVFRELDKIDKIGKKETEKNIGNLIGKEKSKELFKLLAVSGSNDKKLKSAEKLSSEGADELREILDLCSFDIEIDLSLVRGLGYYTGPVYEIKLSRDMGTVVAGGRYDDLMGLYGRNEYATGISVGFERLTALIKSESAETTPTKVFVASVKGYYKDALKTAEKLRTEGINAEADLNERNLKKQFDYANSLKIPLIIIIGEKEAKENKVTLRDMDSGKEEFLLLKDALNKIRGYDV
ncbi:histidine--tRNA ligase [Candidatus Micrarchaeota archaeon]|nr:histidine--tRNA ligase [Candidatus Micrarchaeota archaeon]